jgi:phosphomannomutase
MAIAAGEQVAKEHVGVPVTILANDPDADRFAAAERQPR